MNDKKVLIIGGGIAGLCSGVYLRKAGFEAEILEMHTASGGLATSWQRNGYTFENCLHWLVGSKEGGDMNETWKEVFDIGRLEFFNDDLYQVIKQGAEKLVVYRNVDRMEREFLARAPEDAEAVKRFARLVRKLATLKTSGGDSLFSRLVTLARIVPFLPLLSKNSKLTMADYAEKFKNPMLRSFFASGLDDLSFLAIAFSLAWMTNGNAGYPVGGSLKMIGLIEEQFRRLGGSIRFRAKVDKIIVENGRAAGVVLEGGEKVKSDIVISAADGRATIFGMLGGKFLSDKIRKAYESYKPFPSYVQVSLGIGSAFLDQPGFMSVSLDREIEIDPQTRVNTLSFRIFNFDPTFAPAGKTSVVCFIPTYNHAYWVSSRASDRAKYESDKKRISDEVSRVFEGEFPDAKGKIEVVDVASPATVIRYTGNWKGSFEGWLMTPATGIRQLPAILPGLKDFYMVGQWISPGGGLPSGLMTARAVSRRVCRDNRIPWGTSLSMKRKAG